MRISWLSPGQLCDGHKCTLPHPRNTRDEVKIDIIDCDLIADMFHLFDGFMTFLSVLISTVGAGVGAERRLRGRQSERMSVFDITVL